MNLDRVGDGAFRVGQPTAWAYHRGTARWAFNAATTAASAAPLPGREHPEARWTPLPTGPAPAMPLDEVLAARVSCRAFDTETAVTLAEVATLLHYAYGVLGRTEGSGMSMLDRPAPSAGGLYPLEISVVAHRVAGLPPGVHHYVPVADGLELMRDGDLPRGFLTYLFMGQRWVADAALVIVISAVTGRSLAKYRDRGYRNLLLEAGHVTQNLDLTAAALGLGAVNLGGFYDDELAGLIRVDPEVEIPLYATALGVPAVTLTRRLAIRSLDPEGTRD
jgi:SagB-type dehydrogenase family enzyme